MSAPGRELQFPGRIGLGTWMMGMTRAARASEVAAVSQALAVGYRLLDTAEMYAQGGAEHIIGSALKDFGRSRRGELFIVSKVLPQHASRAGCIRACEASIARMGCDYLDLYLLHWRAAQPLRETLRGFEALRERGLIRHFGVSNFDVDDLAEWLDVQASLAPDAALQCNQLYYCLQSRGIEFALLPWQRQRGIQTMAYSPLAQGRLANHPALQRIAHARGLTAAQIALAWTVRDKDVVAIAKSVQPQRIEQNLQAAQLRLSLEERSALEQAFPPPRTRQALATS